MIDCLKTGKSYISDCESQNCREYSDHIFHPNPVAPSIPMSPVKQNPVGICPPVFYGLISMVQMSFPGIYGQNLRLHLLASQMQCMKELLVKMVRLR